MKLKHTIFSVIQVLLLTIITTYMVSPNIHLLFTPQINVFMPFFIGIQIGLWILFNGLVIADIETFTKRQRYMILCIVFIGCASAISLTIKQISHSIGIANLPYLIWVGALLGIMVLHILLGVEYSKVDNKKPARYA